MKRVWQIFRAVAVAALLVVIVLPVGMYMLLSTPWAQQKLRGIAVSELSDLLGVQVSVGKVMFEPFNSLSVEDISVPDDNGAVALDVDRLSARFELYHFLRTGVAEIDYVYVDGACLKLYRDSVNAPLNVMRIVDRLKSDGNDNKEKHYNLRVNNLVLRNIALNYDVNDMPRRADSIFDANHIHISGLRLNSFAPRIRPGDIDVDVEHLSFAEASGFALTNMTVRAMVGSDSLTLKDFRICLPGSDISFADMVLEYPSTDSIASVIERSGIAASILAGSHVMLTDLRAFAPALARMPYDFKIAAEANISKNDISIDYLTLDCAKLAKLRIDDVVLDIDGKSVDVATLNVHTAGSNVSDLLCRLNVPKSVSDAVRRVTAINLAGALSADSMRAEAKMTMTSSVGRISADISATTHDMYRSYSFEPVVSVEDFDLGVVTADDNFGRATFDISGNGVYRNGLASVDAAAEIGAFDYRSYTYTGISASLARKDNESSLHVTGDSDEYDFDCKINTVKSGKNAGDVYADVVLGRLCPEAMHLTDKYSGYVLSGKFGTQLHGTTFDDISGNVVFRDICFEADSGKTLEIEKFMVECDAPSPRRTLRVQSDFINGTIDGVFTPTTIVADIEAVVAQVLPSLMSDERSASGVVADGNNRFKVDLEIGDAENLLAFFGAPVHAVYPVDITGVMDDEAGMFYVDIDAPFLQQSDKIIENTNVYVKFDARADDARSLVYATTYLPTKKGPLALKCIVEAANDSIDTGIDWTIERAIPLSGHINFATLLSRDDERELCAAVGINPGEITFGDELWYIRPSQIYYKPGLVTVDDFAMNTTTQSIELDGAVGADVSHALKVELDKIELITIFETLEIDKALISGIATGRLDACALLSGEPQITCSGLHVDSIGYNYCTLGDADIDAAWLNDERAVYLDADIHQYDGNRSRIRGQIVPADEALDIDFDANHVPVGFMQPFMSAFASQVEGYASGHARLFGTFKYIDMEGDIYADSLRLKIDFTNTVYSASDSIHLTPGRIDIKDITIYDSQGHTARLNGTVGHTFFKAPTFDFRVTQAQNFLSYNTSSRDNPDWYGTIYGNGSATVSGSPGVVDIGVDMNTAPGSIFTFVLSDRLDAEELSFITFRDVTKTEIRDSLIEVDDVPEAVRDYQARQLIGNTDEPSTYNMDIRVDITPEAQMVLVMDPVGGDRIRANGTGNLRMTYVSTDNDLRMYGTYKLDRGNYNFTLQDIIIKDFTINPGSSITFRGDPYSAQLDIEAVYAVNANLSDLDESFLQDKDLNRTNVPVHALLKVTGDMRQPDIGFDLNFPTLTSDTYRKVRSIVSTDEMMNRQIIYLLALNRFYTPEYMASTTKGNELFSVVSSTISSQLSSMLGKLSDNWSIAPNLRSDRGDFSDVEVDLALSSRLLNNRLLFNGNFGYRDKSLNTNQFIGDFDIEYLLNRRGSWRLKAYNRYNDQNYYVRTAQTTQGVGIMFKRDFDNIFSFLKKRKKSAATVDTASRAAGDTTAVSPPATVSSSEK